MSAGNPYDPPVNPPGAAGPYGTPGPDAAAKVSGPAIALIVVGALNIIASLYQGAQGIMVMMMPEEQMRAQMEAQNPELQGQELPFDLSAFTQGLGAGIIVFYVLTLILGIVIILGAVKMKNLQSRGMAVAASVLAMIPCISPCCLIGLPIGIWSLVTLNDPNVKASFK
jgi:hypothetical protein